MDSQSLERNGKIGEPIANVKAETLKLGDAAIHAKRGDGSGKVDAVFCRTPPDPGASFAEQCSHFIEPTRSGPKRHPYLTPCIGFIGLSGTAITCSRGLNAKRIDQLARRNTFQPFHRRCGEEHCSFERQDKIPRIHRTFRIESSRSIGTTAGCGTELPDGLVGKTIDLRLEERIRQQRGGVRSRMPFFEIEHFRQSLHEVVRKFEPAIVAAGAEEGGSWRRHR